MDMNTVTFVGTEIAATVAGICVWILIVVVAHELMHRFLSTSVADNKRTVKQLQETVVDQQRQIDDLKRELEEIKQKQSFTEPQS